MKYNKLGIIVPIGGNKEDDVVLRCIKSIKYIDTTSYFIEVCYVFTDEVLLATDRYPKSIAEIKKAKYEHHIIFRNGSTIEYNSAMWGRYTGITHCNADIVCYVDCDDMVSNEMANVYLDIFNSRNSDLVELPYMCYPSITLVKPQGFIRDDPLYLIFPMDGTINCKAVYAIRKDILLKAHLMLKDISQYQYLALSYGEDLVEQVAINLCIDNYNSGSYPVYLYYENVGICSQKSPEYIEKKLSDLELVCYIIGKLTDSRYESKVRSVYSTYIEELKLNV